MKRIAIFCAFVLCSPAVQGVNLDSVTLPSDAELGRLASAARERKAQDPYNEKYWCLGDAASQYEQILDTRLGDKKIKTKKLLYIAGQTYEQAFVDCKHSGKQPHECPEACVWKQSWMRSQAHLYHLAAYDFEDFSNTWAEARHLDAAESYRMAVELCPAQRHKAGLHARLAQAHEDFVYKGDRKGKQFQQKRIDALSAAIACFDNDPQRAAIGARWADACGHVVTARGEPPRTRLVEAAQLLERAFNATNAVERTRLMEQAGVKREEWRTYRGPVRLRKDYGAAYDVFGWGTILSLGTLGVGAAVKLARFAYQKYKNRNEKKDEKGEDKEKQAKKPWLSWLSKKEKIFFGASLGLAALFALGFKVTSIIDSRQDI